MSLRRIRTERVRADETALLQIKTRLERVQHEHDATQVLLAETQRAADELSRELWELQDMETYTTERLVAGRAALVQECISALPADVLRYLFEVAARDDPFSVAAVCVRWRAVALDCPAMWSQISLPIPHFSMEDIEAGNCQHFLADQLQRTTILLDRSRKAPLDIYIPWAGVMGLGIVHVYSSHLFDIIGRHADRWRTATIGLPSCLGHAALDYLRGPTPLLVQLDVCVARGDPSFYHPQSGYLPYAPRLRKLVLTGCGLGCAASSDFRNLEELVFRQKACTDEQLYQYLRLAAATLDNITLRLTLTHAPATTLTLPRLRGLHLGEPSFPLACPSLVVPALTSLGLVSSQSLNSPDILAGMTPSDTLIPFLEAVSPTVKYLLLGYVLTDECLSIVSHLKNVDQLRFFRPASYFPESVIERLTGRPPIWPKLTCITNLRWVADHGCEGVMRLIASRNSEPESGASEQDTVRPCKLRQVVFEPGAPQWLLAEVRRLLAS